MRVYGLWTNSGKEVLVTDEIHFGNKMTKFPGGGLQFGEGLVECLAREWSEEVGIEATIISHFYTTDFFQLSAFDADQQIISVYYKVSCDDESAVKVVSEPFDGGHLDEGSQIFRWLPVSSLSPADFTFPIDKKVAELLCLT